MSIPRPVQIRSRLLVLPPALLVATLLASCAGDAPPSDSSDAAAADRTGIPDPSSASPTTGAPQVDGAVSFQVDGRAVELDYLPEDHNYYMRLGASVLARSGPDSEEQFVLILSGTDLRTHEIPGELPPEGAGSSIATAMQLVGFSYTDPSGQEWAGPGRVYVESFTEAGVLTARFDSVTIPHTDRELPDLTLTNGRVRAEL